MKKRTIYTLLVAIDNYPNPRHRLEGCLNDAQAIQEFLIHRCEGNSNDSEIQLELKTLFDEQATKSNIVEAFRLHLGKAQKDDVALFYYCGHGAEEVCPPQFRYLEPNGKNQSIVCYDSRDPKHKNGNDLADKELAVLISEVAQNNPHFVVIMDCCHSGRGTRSSDNSRTKTRQIQTLGVPRKLDTFVGYENISPDIKEVKVPEGNHILFSAARSSQTAKETTCEGKQQGVFTYALLKVLREAKSPLSYGEIARRIRPIVTNLVDSQHPQIEVHTIRGEKASDTELHKKFLDGQLQPKEPFYTITYNSKLQKWTADAGAVHGLPQKVGKNSKEQISLSIYSENAPIDDLRNPEKAIAEALISEVAPEYSVINFDSKIDADEIGTVYKAKIKNLPIQKIPFWVDCSVDMTAHLLREADKKTLSYANLIAEPKGAIYKISERTSPANPNLKHYRISRPENDIPLVLDYVYDPFDDRDEIENLCNDIEQIAKWYYLKNLNNPDTSFPTSAVSLEVHRVYETDDYGTITKSEVVPMGSDFRFEQLPMDGTKEEEHEYYVDFALKIKNKSNQPLFCSLLFMSSAFGVDNSLIPIQKLNPKEEVWAWEKDVLPIGVSEASLKFGITEVTETFKLIYSTNEFDSNLYAQDDLTLPEAKFRALGKRGKRVKVGGKKTDWATFTQEITVFSLLPAQNFQRLPENRLLSEGKGIFLNQKDKKLAANIQLKSETQLSISNKNERLVNSENIIPEIFEELDSEYVKFSEGRENDLGLSILEISDIQDETVVTEENPLELDLNYEDLAENEFILPVVSDGKIVFPVGISEERPSGGTSIKIHHLPVFEDENQKERGFGKSVKMMLQKLKVENLGGEFGYPILAKVEIDEDGEDLKYLGENQAECLEIIQKEVEKIESPRILLFIHGVLGETKKMALSAQKAQFETEKGIQSIGSQYDLILTFDYESMNTSLEEVADQLAKNLRKVGVFGRNEKGRIVKKEGLILHLITHSMGGLVARQFIEKNGGNKVVDHLVMVGTPNLGSPWSRIEDLATMGLTLILSKISLATWAVSPLVLLIKQFDKKWKTLDQLNPKSDFYRGLNAEEAPNSGIPYTIIAGNTQENSRMNLPDTQRMIQQITNKISGVKSGVLDKLIFKSPNDIAVSVESILAEELWEHRKQDIHTEIVSCDHLSYFSEPEGLEALAKVIFERVN